MSMDKPPEYRSTSAGVFSPYRWGEHKWEDYVFDTQQLLYQGFGATIAQSRRMSDRLGDLNDTMSDLAARADARQAELLGSFEDFALAAGASLDRIGDHLNTLCDITCSGFDVLDRHLASIASILVAINEKLDRIVKSLENPLQTAANELFRQGEYALERGLYREAFGDFASSEAKRPINPILHVHLAQLYYHIKADDLLFDFERAQHHVDLAIRYGTALEGDFGREAGQMLDLVYRTAAHLAFVRSGDLWHLGLDKDSKAYLARARMYLARIHRPSAATRFLSARVAAAAQDAETLVQELRSLADFNRAWIALSLGEFDLRRYADAVGTIQSQLDGRPGPHTARVRRAVVWAKAVSAELHSIESGISPVSADLEDVIDQVSRYFLSGSRDAGEAVDEILARVQAAVSALRPPLEDARQKALTQAHVHTNAATAAITSAKQSEGKIAFGCPISIAAVLGPGVLVLLTGQDAWWLLFWIGVPVAWCAEFLWKWAILAAGSEEELRLRDLAEQETARADDLADRQVSLGKLDLRIQQEMPTLRIPGVEQELFRKKTK